MAPYLNRNNSFGWLLPLLALNLFILMASQAAAVTYYVSVAGSDANSGLSGAPFRTIQKAADAVRPGDRVIIKDGIYTAVNKGGIGRAAHKDNFIVNLKRGGTADNWIIFTAENRWGAKLDGQNNITEFGFMLSSNAQYVRIENLEVYGFGKGGFWFNGRAHHIYFYANNIHDIGRRCSSDKYGQAGVYQGTKSAYVTYDSNLIHHIGRFGWPSAPAQHKCATAGPLDGYNDHGLYLNGPYTTVINNIFYENNSGYDIDIKAQYCKGCGSHYTIVNNTLGQSAYAGREHDYNVGRIILAGNNEDVLIQNNIFYSSGPKYAIYNNSPDDWSLKTNIRIKNNLAYHGAIINSIKGDFAIVDNMINTDPKFADGANYDFHLQSTSPAINKGLSAGAPSSDFDKKRRPHKGSCAIGAYEYTERTSEDRIPPRMSTGSKAPAVSFSHRLTLTLVIRERHESKKTL